MNGYEITTAHNVTLRLGYASPGNRVLAYLLDTIIKVAYICVLIFAGFFMSALKFDSGHFTGLWIFMCFLLGLPVLFYSLLFEYFTGGQTPGKRALKIKVVSLNSDQLSFGQCLIRWLFRIVDFGFCYGIIALVAVSVSQRKQRVGDIVAGTIVVSLEAEKTLDQTIYSYVNPQREVRYQEAAHLSAREIEVIKEVLRQYESDGKYDLVPVTAERVRAAISAPADTDDLGFLRAVVEDYYTLAAV